jgi:hypothetical protein
MKRIKIFLTTSFLLLTFLAKSQTPTFTIVMSPADSLREAGDLKGAIEEFRKIYISDPKSDNNIYNFACALAVTRQNDSCFKYLYKAIELDTATNALTDPDFISVKDDKRWNEFEDKLISMLNIKFNYPYKNIDYAKKLWRMQAKDQAYYSEIDIAEKKTGMNSTVVRALWTLKHIYNEESQKQLEKLIEEKGWPKISDVGGRAAGAAFLIIQHSDNDKQKKYLPTIEKLCKEKEASWQSYALMYDRIQTSDNKPQKYGSQVTFNDKTNKYELFPLLDETKVDEWRKEIGMQPLAEYVSRWEIKFEPKKK